jgi:kynurenine formamidase
VYVKKKAGSHILEGIYLIEYLCNLHQVKAKRVKLFAAPLKVEGAEAAPARVIAVID